MTPRRGAVVAAASAFALRAAIAFWGARFPAAADGTYYDIVARRIAEGRGYTWLWPDGAVTYAAHYPIGYPALIGAFYALFGARVVVAAMVNAALGALGVLAAHDVLARATPPRRALLGALAVALHPALLLYTPAVMTEAPTAALLTVALAFATRAREAERSGGWLAATGLALGAATLVRPQCILLAPMLGFLAAAGHTTSLRRRGARALAVSALALACCLPWTLRNCVRMDQCALVSVNGGWNLLIGAQTSTGAWAPVEVPGECREVFAEAEKDACFGRAARAEIAKDVLGFVAKAPRKIAVTFDYFGAAPWYLHTANAQAFDARAKLLSGALETVAARALLIAALVACARRKGPRDKVRMAVAMVGAVFACLEHGWGAYVALAACITALGPRALGREAPLLAWTAALVLATMATHAAFFGAGRYGLVVVPFVSMLAFLGADRPRDA